MFARLKKDIQVVFERDPAAKSVLEVIINYPGLHAIWFHRISHFFYQRQWYVLARFISQIGRFFTQIEIHPGAKIGEGLFIDHGAGVVIGETAEIGDNVTIYQGVTLGGTGKEKGKRHPTLGNGVVVGAGAKVLGPIEIGDNARIGSNAVVVRSVSADTTIVGIPGRVATNDSVKPSPEQEEMAKKIGFDAYGASQELPDPVAVAINSMLEHIHTMDKEMERMCHEIKSLGGGMDDRSVEEINSEPVDDGKGSTCPEARAKEG